MCGICGVYSPGAAAEPVAEVVRTMNIALKHRGPDGEGLFSRSGIALGHRRLSIIDVENGQQPMLSPDGKVCLTYNGEIYNYKQLKERLINKGHHFITDSDTEVILHAWLRYGVDCVDHLDGMYAFAIWDSSSQVLFLARDRLGIKPLYYTHVGNQFIFASEIKSLLAHPSVEARLKDASVAEYLFSTSLTNRNTMFQDIYSLEAGFRLTIDNQKINRERYWDIPSLPPETETLDETDYKESVRTALLDSVSKHIISDVPISSLLSGGVDSSLITILVSRLVAHRLSTFTMEYDGNHRRTPDSTSDIHYARHLASRHGFAYNEFVFNTSEYMDCFDQVTWQVEKPIEFTTPSSFLMYREVAKKSKVVLTGEGADELFAGYYFFLKEASNGNLTEFPWAPFSKEVSSIIRPDFYRRTGYQDAIKNDIKDLLASFETSDFINQVLYMFLKVYLQEMLERQDKTSMAHGVEARVPFLDHQLVTLISNIPSKYKHHDGVEKYLLRESMKNDIDHTVLYRKKKPFPFPVDPLTMSRQIKRAGRLVQDKNSRIREYFDPQRTEEFYQRTNNFKDLDSLALFRTSHAMIALDSWHRAYGV